MRFLLLLSFLFCHAFSFAQTPDTIVEHWSNGRIRSVKIYLQKEPQGCWKTYNEFGGLIRETNYDQGKLHGKQASFADNGNQLSLEYFRNGLQDSVRYVWFSDGHLQAEENYSNGEREGLSRTFFHDGRTHTYSFYQNHVLEGRYFEANDEGLTVEEGWALHGRWVWQRKFCNNKLCEMRGLDTISGVDSVRYFDVRGNMTQKIISWEKDSLPCKRSFYFRTDGLLYKEIFEGAEDDGYYYRRTSLWQSSPVYFLSEVQTDSCHILQQKDFLRWHNADFNANTSVRKRYCQFYPDGKIQKLQSGNHEHLHEILFYPDGRIMKEGNYWSGIHWGLWTSNTLNSDSLWINKHTWYNDKWIYADTSFYPNGKVQKAYRLTDSVNVKSLTKEYYTSGALQRNRIEYAQYGNYDDIWYYENGKNKHWSIRQGDFISSTESICDFFENGKFRYIKTTMTGHLRILIIEETDYENGLPKELRVTRIPFKMRDHARIKVRYRNWYENGNPKIKSRYRMKREKYSKKVFLRGHVKHLGENGGKIDRRHLGKKNSVQDAEN